jgi:hypothetical protein
LPELPERQEPVDQAVKVLLPLASGSGGLFTETESTGRSAGDMV